MGNDANNSLVGARLTYYIFEGVPVGTAGGRLIHLLALSGGGGARDLKKVDRKKTLVDPQLTDALEVDGGGILHVEEAMGGSRFA